MTQLKNFFISLALATGAASASADAPVEVTEAPVGVVEGLSADASPEAEAQSDAFVAKWEAAARAAGIDPESVEAGTGEDKSSR